jgi:23S rRNA (guanosine2251-2'-O)-methyltransferase
MPNNTFKKNRMQQYNSPNKPNNSSFESHPIESADTDISDDNVVLGRNSVTELLLSERNVEKIFLIAGCEEKFKKRIYDLATKKRVPVVKTDKAKMDSFGKNHQGVVAIAATKDYCEIEDIIELAKSKNEKPFVIVADGINDPHNLGAIIRSAECAGVHGIIIPKRHSVSVTPVVHKSSAGASEHMLIAKVSNLASAIDELKKHGLWIYTMEADGEDYSKTVFDAPTCIIMGSEGDGVSELLRKKSDFVLSIPMYGKINSLNVSAAAAIIMFKAAPMLKKQ